jgi:hypothetical protein
MSSYKMSRRGLGKSADFDKSKNDHIKKDKKPSKKGD